MGFRVITIKLLIRLIYNRLIKYGMENMEMSKWENGKRKGFIVLLRLNK